MSGAVMFGPVIGSVVGSWALVVSKLALEITTAKPMESHVHFFSAVLLDVVGDDAMCCAVVSLDGCGRLLVAHLFEEVLHGDCFTGVDVEGTKFGFGPAGHDSLENFGCVEDGSIVGWIINISRAEEVTTNTAVGMVC
jgi:hypothetical protein